MTAHMVMKGRVRGGEGGDGGDYSCWGENRGLLGLFLTSIISSLRQGNKLKTSKLFFLRAKQAQKL